MSDVMTLREVASLLKVHPNTVYRLARSGRLPAFKTGTDWRFQRVAVESWMRSPSRHGDSSSSDEVFHLVYWMLSQGFSLTLTPGELTLLLDCTPRVVKRSLDALSRRGWVGIAQGRVALTPEGIGEAHRRFGARGQPTSGHESVRMFAERHGRP